MNVKSQNKTKDKKKEKKRIDQNTSLIVKLYIIPKYYHRSKPSLYHYIEKLLRLRRKAKLRTIRVENDILTL